jgi:preprotein translocase subunit SecG
MLLDILLAILIVVCLSLIGVILLQRSEGGALGMSGGGPGAFMTARGTGDLLTRTTQILAAVFFALCLGMTLISGHSHNAGSGSLVDKLKLNALGATSSEKPLSGTPGLPGVPQNNPAQPFGTPAQPFGAPQPQGSSLNLLGSPQTPLAAPVAHPTAVTPAAPKPAVTVKPAAAPMAPKAAALKPAKPTKAATAAPKAAASSAPASASAPAVTPAPLTVPPPPAPPSGAGNSTSGQ